MRIPDRVSGLFLVGLGAAAAYGGWQLPPVPGQPVGPNVFPLVIGLGLALCGLAIAFVIPALWISFSHIRVATRVALIDAGYWLVAYLAMGLVFYLFG